MIIYGSTMSPFVRKAVAFAAEKGLEVELRPTKMGDDNPEFREASPFGKMPGLIDGDYSLSDSSAICHYLEAKQPEPRLIPADSRGRGKTVWFDEFADTILFDCGRKMFFNRIVAPRFLGREGDMDAADKAEREELPPILDYLEKVVRPDGYLVGEGLTLADIAVASPFANFEHCGVKLDRQRHGKVMAYVERILSRPSFATSIERERSFLARPA